VVVVVVVMVVMPSCRNWHGLNIYVAAEQLARSALAAERLRGARVRSTPFRKFGVFEGVWSPFCNTIYVPSQPLAVPSERLQFFLRSAQALRARRSAAVLPAESMTGSDQASSEPSASMHATYSRSSFTLTYPFELACPSSFMRASCAGVGRIGLSDALIHQNI
jgi:hypothetical protein